VRAAGRLKVDRLRKPGGFSRDRSLRERSAPAIYSLAQKSALAGGAGREPVQREERVVSRTYAAAGAGLSPRLSVAGVFCDNHRKDLPRTRANRRRTGIGLDWPSPRPSLTLRRKSSEYAETTQDPVPKRGLSEIRVTLHVRDLPLRDITKPLAADAAKGFEASEVSDRQRLESSLPLGLPSCLPLP
jgi:hypothetical protein